MTISERQWHLIYSCIVAGKSASFTNIVVDRLKARMRPALGKLPPFLGFRTSTIPEIRAALLAVSSGNYTKLSKCFHELGQARTLDLEKCTPAELEKIHGIGPKTSRFFILWTRPGERYAALDVHVLRWMRSKGYPAPKSTPAGEKYRVLEIAFLKEADARGMTARELDHKIWDAGASAPNIV